jgi:hypothetical protein
LLRKEAAQERTHPIQLHLNEVLEMTKLWWLKAICGRHGLGMERGFCIKEHEGHLCVMEVFYVMFVG